jgi:hypothetical protein
MYAYIGRGDKDMNAARDSWEQLLWRPKASGALKLIGLKLVEVSSY